MRDLSERISRAIFNFSIPRFWSSPDLVPGRTIIAHVLCNPTHSDLMQIVAYFGFEDVNDVLDQVAKKREIHPTVRRYCERHLDYLRQTYTEAELLESFADLCAHSDELAESMKNKRGGA